MARLGFPMNANDNVVLSSPEWREYRTMLRKGAKKGPNFASHFTVVQWGCGTQCSTGAELPQSFSVDDLIWTTSVCSYGPFFLLKFSLGLKPIVKRVPFFSLRASYKAYARLHVFLLMKILRHRTAQHVQKKNPTTSTGLKGRVLPPGKSATDQEGILVVVDGLRCRLAFWSAAME